MDRYSFRGNNNRKKALNNTKHSIWTLLEKKFGKEGGKRISPGMMEVLLDSFYMMEKILTDYKLKSTQPEIIIRPYLENITFRLTNSSRT